jgi:tetratricopeptide (TPR) repeat protein
MRDRAARLQRGLANEQRKYRHIEDGAGKRYLIGPFYVLAGELEKALAHYEWYERKCPDDIGEPMHYVYWALALYRTGETRKANAKLLETMLQNVYLLPILLGLRPDPHDIWHGSNMEHPDYITQVPNELLPQLSEQERAWIAEQFDSFRFRRVREEYVATYRALKDEKNIDKRRQILRRWNDFLATSASIDS